MECICAQAQLNQGGGWERLCTERDPFILTGLMWSWLEQLKEPVISPQEALALNPDHADAHAVLNTLDKVHFLIYSDANQENVGMNCCICLPGPQRNNNLHSGLYGSYDECTRRGGEGIPEPHRQGFHLGEI